MHLRSLNQLVEVVRALTQAEQIVVLGSASLLASDGRLGERGAPLEVSYDADLLVRPIDEQTAAVVHEAVGEGSLFHRQHACFAELLRPEIEETLPDGWAGRLVPLAGQERVGCLEPHDLALVKLALGREKDMNLLGVLLKLRLIDPGELRRRFQALRWDEPRMRLAGRHLARLLGKA
jgi:hypothetical protein